MALISSRNGQAGGCPVVAADGSSGSKTAHSASVRSLAKRSRSRVCCARVVAVQMNGVHPTRLDNPLQSHLTVATQPPFRQRSETASQLACLPSKPAEWDCYEHPIATLVKLSLAKDSVIAGMLVPRQAAAARQFRS